MAENLQNIVPVDNAEARRELLEQQFEEVALPVEKAVAIEEPVEEPVWRRPPASWKNEYREAWQTVDPKIQEYTWQRENEMRAGLQPFAEKAHYADQMQTAIQPYLQTIKGLGIEPHKAVEALMQADNALRTGSQQERLAYFAQLASQYGVNLGQMGQMPQQMAVDPHVYALQNELNNVRGEVAGWKQQQEQAENSAILSEIEKFALNAEYFEEARPAMIQLLQGGMATDLNDAYEKAVRLDQNLSESINRNRQDTIETQRRAVANKAAKSARAAAVSVRSSTPGTQTNTKAQDRRSLLSEQFDGISERL